MFENLLDDWTSTYAGKLDTTVTALGSGTLLLDVKVTELATGSLDDSDLVGLGVVAGSSICQRVCFMPEVAYDCAVFGEYRAIVDGRFCAVVRCEGASCRFVQDCAVSTYGCLRRCEEGQYVKISVDSISPGRT